MHRDNFKAKMNIRTEYSYSVLKNGFPFLQIANNKWIPGVIYRPVRHTISHYSG